MADDPSKKTASDIAYGIGKGAVASFPFVGGALSELYGLLITEPASKRRDKWLQEIFERLLRLEEADAGVVINNLAEDSAFTSVLMNATYIAVRTHQHEKIDALRNAVLNSAIGVSVDDSLKSIMLNLIDRFTPLHMAILRLLQAPKGNQEVARKAANLHTGALVHVVGAAFPDLAANRELLNLIWKDLYDSGLISTEAPHGMMTGHGLVEKRTTQLGDSFLAFISDPIANDAD